MFLGADAKISTNQIFYFNPDQPVVELRANHHVCQVLLIFLHFRTCSDLSFQNAVENPPPFPQPSKEQQLHLWLYPYQQ